MKNKKRHIKKYHKYFPLLITLLILLMSVGYALINSITLDVKGETIASTPEGLSIISYVLVTDDSSEGESSNIISSSQNVMNSSIELSSTNLSSKITYKITVYNFTAEEYTYFGTSYDPTYYTNSTISYSISDISENEKILGNSYKTFYITFEYASGVTEITNNKLDSVISFDFGRAFTVTYENIIDNNYPTQVMENQDLTITFADIAPSKIVVSGAESYEYSKPYLYINNAQSNLVISAWGYSIDSYTFDGKTDYINTGLQLFSDANVNRDFEIYFEITEMGANNVHYATLVNAMDESGSPWPGFTCRYEEYNSGLKFFTVANSGKSSNSGFYDPTIVKIQRIDNVLYYQFDNGENTNFFDFSSLITTFDTPLTIGASLDGSGNPFRYFEGTLSNISAEFLN